MSFGNPANDINPELANGCGSLALEDIWLSYTHPKRKNANRKVFILPHLPHSLLASCLYALCCLVIITTINN